MLNDNKNDSYKNQCNQYPNEIIMNFIDNELDADMYEQVKAHIELCVQCKNEIEAYRKLDHIFEAQINTRLKDIDLIKIKSTIFDRINTKKQNPFYKQLFDNIYNKSNYAVLSLLKTRNYITRNYITRNYVQVASLVAIVLCSFFYFKGDIVDVKSNIIQDVHQSVHLSNEVSLLQDAPNAIITSVKGDISSLMILESEDKTMTIIWYKEV